MKKNGTINELEYDSLFQSGSRPCILYGLPKVNKSGVPFKPILSSISTCAYGLSKFLVPLLRPFSLDLYTVKESFSIIQELLSLDYNSDNLTMASFDIKSLFANIPLDEIIHIIISKSFNNIRHFHNFTCDDFSKLLRFSVKNLHFLFNSVLYEQTDGVAMGSPLGPVFADIFLSWHECTWLTNCPPQVKLLYYRRYVDDCFLLFRSPNHIKPFLHYMNNQHPRIVFTQEAEDNNSLPFLDILITRQNGFFTTSVYQKPTFGPLPVYIPISIAFFLLFLKKVCSSDFS